MQMTALFHLVVLGLYLREAFAERLFNNSSQWNLNERRG